MRLFALWLGMLIGLCGCSAPGDARSAAAGQADPRLARLDGYEALRLAVLGDADLGLPGLARTPLAHLPSSGHLNLSGYATLRVEDPENPLVLYGDATLRVDYDAGQTSGQMDGFFGAGADAVIVDFEGVVGLAASGALGQDDSLDYQGVLTGAGSVLVLDGVLETQILGDPVSAIAAADLGARVQDGSTTHDATLVVVTAVAPAAGT